MQVFRGRQTGGDGARTETFAVLVNGQRLRGFIDDDAVKRVRLDRAQRFGADIAADERAVLIAVSFHKRPAVIQIFDEVQTLAEARDRTELFALAGAVVDISGFAFFDVYADHGAGERRPDFSVA